ncbi:transcriptional regulator [Planotetraspora thailandica]|uniref:Transcriptional regulator n=1 Tax=Planotetraspora thailandica TaxID=487172 RepID=A0A8J3V253_9ACTN|nr:helix-turn-helix domain-containing protein [Planotetraspora thailandica]GII54117.1 transcriptional regulator [Planotetraspora thailandica]
MQDIADEIARILDASVTLEDRSFNLLAYGAQSGDIDTVRQESILRRRATDEVRAHFEAYGIATATGPVRIPGLPGMLGRVCVPLRHAGVTYGYLWLLDSGALTDERLASVAPLVERAAAQLAHEARGRQARLRDFFSADPGIRAAAGVEAEGPVTAIAVRTTSSRAAALWSLPRGVLAEPAADEALLAVLAPAPQAGEAARRLHDMYGTAAGVGGPRDDPQEAWESWREALVALKVAEHVERHAPVASWADLGVYRLLARLSHRELAELAAESAALSAGELAETVEDYLDHGGHVQETAEHLGIHRQTLYYRLGKAERLTGFDLDDGESRLLLHLSLKAAALVGGHRGA